MSYSSELISTIKEWILDIEIGRVVDLFLLTNNIDIISRVLELNLQPIGRIIVLNTINKTNNIFMKFPGKIIITDEYRVPIRRSYFFTFIDFAGKNVIGGTGTDLFSNKIEWTPVFRRGCQKLLLYNYSGSDISYGYFKVIKIDGSYIYMQPSKWGKISQNVPIPTMTTMGEGSKIFDEEKSKKWISELKEFIRVFFTILLEDEKDEDMKKQCMELFLNEDSMIIWVKGFIHRTVNMIYNNDGLEHFGDRLLLSDFARYLHGRFPRITSDEATGFQNIYLARKKQQIFSDDLMLFDRLLKNTLRPEQKSKTDIFESFVACIEKVSQGIENLSNVMISKFVYALADSLPFTKDVTFGISKEKIKAINNSFNKFTELKFAFKADITSQDKGEGKIVGIYTPIPEEIMEFFYEIDTKNGRNLPEIQDNMISILNITEAYFDNFEELDDVENKIWDRISTIYDRNNVTIIKTVKEDPIFELLRRNDPGLFNDLDVKLRTEFQKSTISDFGFVFDKKQGYVVFYKIIHQIKDGFAVGETAHTDYSNPLSFLEQRTNLSTVPFSMRRDIRLRDVALTTLQVSKLDAIRAYIIS